MECEVFNPGNKFDSRKRRALEHVFCSASSQATFTTTSFLKEDWVAGGDPELFLREPPTHVPGPELAGCLGGQMGSGMY